MKTIQYKHYSCTDEEKEIEKDPINFYPTYSNSNILHKCYECDKIVAFDPNHDYGYGSPCFKLRPCLKCPHCGKWYCSYNCMQPRNLVSCSKKIEPITGLISHKVYQLCDLYIKSLKYIDDDPFMNFCENDNEVNQKLMQIFNYEFHCHIADHYAFEQHVISHFKDPRDEIFRRFPILSLERCLWLFIGCKNCLTAL